jgi:hypothetical protein
VLDELTVTGDIAMGARISGNFSGEAGAVQDLIAKAWLEDDDNNDMLCLNRGSKLVRVGGGLSTGNDGDNPHLDSNIIGGSHMLSAPWFMRVHLSPRAGNVLDLNSGTLSRDLIQIPPPTTTTKPFSPKQVGVG